MPGGYYYYYGYTGFSYILIILPAILLAAWAQYNVQSTYRKYSAKLSSRGMSGADVARMILNSNGLYNVRIEMINGKLTDNFDPRSNIVHLSQGVYTGSSVAAIGVAAHECGHAVQYGVGYFPIRLRNSVIPMTKFGSGLALPLIFVGIIFSWSFLILAGIVLFSLAVFFQIITLPVEFNASRRALKTLDGDGILYGQELEGAKKVLKAAALTYVAATLVSLAYLLQYILVFMGARRRN